MVVLLNGKPIIDPLAFSEAEGWVDIIDITALAPILPESSSVTLDDGDEPVVSLAEVPLKRLYGEVEVRQTPPRSTEK